MSFTNRYNFPKGTKLSIEENRKLSDRFGDSRADGQVRINTAKGDVVNTVIHELLHVEDFTKSEAQVIKESGQIEKKMGLADAGLMLLEASQAQAYVPPRVIHHTRAGNVISDNIN